MSYKIGFDEGFDAGVLSERERIVKIVEGIVDGIAVVEDNLIDCGRVYGGKKCSEMTHCSGCGKGYRWGSRWRHPEYLHALSDLKEKLTKDAE